MRERILGLQQIGDVLLLVSAVLADGDMDPIGAGFVVFPDDLMEAPLSPLFRSGTSIGANMNEAKHPQSDADFLSKANIALKEARETEYWQKLLHDNGYINDSQFTSLNSDLSRILRILVTIVGKVKKRIGGK